jgi:uncharacterized protein (DUF427 family)
MAVLWLLEFSWVKQNLIHDLSYLTIYRIICNINFTANSRHPSQEQSWGDSFFVKVSDIPCENHRKHPNASCEQNAKYWYVRAGGKQSNHWAWRNFCLPSKVAILICQYLATLRTLVRQQCQVPEFLILLHADSPLVVYFLFSCVKALIKKPMVWVCERTIPTERLPLVGEVIANFCG